MIAIRFRNATTIRVASESIAGKIRLDVVLSRETAERFGRSFFRARDAVLSYVGEPNRVRKMSTLGPPDVRALEYIASAFELPEHRGCILYPILDRYSLRSHVSKDDCDDKTPLIAKKN